MEFETTIQQIEEGVRTAATLCTYTGHVLQTVGHMFEIVVFYLESDVCGRHTVPLNFVDS